MIITIARQSGCSGKQVGQLLAEHYHIPLYDKDALIDMAQKTGLYESIPNFFSETPVNSLLYSIAAGYGEYDALQVPVHALQNLIGEQDCVVIGRCSNYAFQNRPDSVRIFLSADRDVRVQNLENWKNIKITDELLERLYQTFGEKNVKAGDNMLTPYQALAYCRIRQDITGEFGRTDRQRKILISVFNELKSEDIMTITNICMKALKYVTTDLTEKQIRSLLTSVITMGATEIEQLRIPYEGSYTEGRLSGNGAWVMQVDYEANKKALQYFVFGIGEDPGINDSYGIGNDKFIDGYYPEKTEGISTY